MEIGRYKVEHAALTDIGLKRKVNEDSIGFIETEFGYVFIVCDGMGGHEGGETASKTGVRFIIEYLSANAIGNPAIALYQAVIFANEQIYLAAKNNQDLKGMGTTAAVLLFHKDEIYTAHAGDSRIYVLNDGQFLQLTKDHSVVQNMVDNGVINNTEAESHPRKNEITKALGIYEQIIPSVNNKPFKSKTGDRFVICSDGLSGMIGKEIFKKTVQNFQKPNACVKELVALANKGGGEDNISVQMIDIIQSPFAKSEYYNKQPAKAVQGKRIKESVRNVIIISAATLLVGLSITFGISWHNRVPVHIRHLKPIAPPATIINPLYKHSREKIILLDRKIQFSFLTKEQAIDNVKGYFKLKKEKDTAHYIDSFNACNYNYLIAKSVLSFILIHSYLIADTLGKSVYKKDTLFMLSNGIWNRLRNKVQNNGHIPRQPLKNTIVKNEK